MVNDSNIVKVSGKSTFGGDERTTLPEMGPYAPLPEPQCKTCRYAMKGAYGYKNGKCYKYRKDAGKPNDILFRGAKCTYYRKDRSNEKEETK